MHTVTTADDCVATCIPQGTWLAHMVQLSRQLARLHYRDLEHAVSIEMLQVDDKCCHFSLH
jgi:hypothetical protein